MYFFQICYFLNGKFFFRISKYKRACYYYYYLSMIFIYSYSFLKQ